tara:strand:+ start:393 stop:1043 length:651 start_codon:yes stop_codon:yes gene_type:complete
MADLKISALPASTVPLAGTEVLAIVQSGTTKQVTVDNLTTGKAVAASTVAATTVTATTVNGTTFDTNIAAAGVTLAGTTLAADGTDTNIDVTVTPKGTGVVTSGSTYNDAYGKVRAISQSGSAKTASYTLVVADVGRFIELGTGGAIVVPDATFAAGDAVVIFNNTSGDITITLSITTAYLAGTDADKATLLLATRGVCNILFISSTVCVVTGSAS